MKIRIQNKKKGYVEIEVGRTVRLHRGQTAQVDVETAKDGTITGPESLLHAINVGDVDVIELGEAKLPAKKEEAAVPAIQAEAPAPKTKKVKKEEPAADSAPVLPLIPNETEEEA